MNFTLPNSFVLLSSALISLTTPSFAQTVVPPEAVLASNSRANVTYEDLIAELERLPEEHRLEFMLSEKRIATVIENMLINKIMTLEAQQTNLQNKPKAIAEIRNQTEKVLAKYRREELEATAPKIDLVPLAREIFLTRMKDLERPALYTVWHILIKTKGRTKAAMLARANEVKAKIDAGAPLDTVANDYSDDESVSINRGFIRPTPLSYLDPNFAKALEKLKPKESTIVETEYGIHVVRLIEMTPRHRPTFDEVKLQMVAEADKVYKQRIVSTYADNIRTDPTIKFNTENLDKIRPRLPEIPPPASAPVPTRPF